MGSIYSRHEYSVLIEWMEAALETHNSQLQTEIADWMGFYSMISSLGLASILFSVMENLPEARKPDAGLQKRWRSQVAIAASLQLVKLHQMQAVVNALEELHISAIVLKGAAVSRFYEYPEYRLMNDVDLLVSAEDQSRAQEAIEALGYRIAEEKTTPMHLGFQKTDAVGIELHRALFRPRFLGLVQNHSWYADIWRNSGEVEKDELAFRAMSVEDELINQVLHFTRHFMNGKYSLLRNIFDIALIIRKCEERLDWRYIERTLDSLKLIRIGRLLFSICGRLFSGKIPEAMTMQPQAAPEEFLFRFLTCYTAKNEPDETICWNIAYRRLPVLCNCRLLLPVVWIVELYLQFKSRVGSVPDCFRKAWRNAGMFHARVCMMKRLGLFIT